MEGKTQSIKPKRILYVITKANFGGAQKYVFEMANQAHKDGNEVSVLVGGEGLLVEKLSEAKIPVIVLKNLKRDINIFNEFGSFFEMIKVFKKLRPDVVHLNSSKASGLGALAARLTGIKKVIFTIHGWAFNEDRNWFQKLLIKKIYFLTILLSSVSIAVSENTKNQARKIPFSFLIKHKIKVVHNGIQEIDFLEKKEARVIFEKHLGINQNDFIVVTLAELHPIKGLEFLIEAASKISNPEIKFYIFGEGEIRKTLQSQIDDLGLQNKAFLPGRMDNGAKFLKAFDIFVLPSLSEAMPLSVIEAGFAGLPIIASNVGGIPEIIDNHENGILVSPKNSGEIAKAILEIYSDPEKTNRFGQKIKDKVSKEFSFEKMYSETIKNY